MRASHASMAMVCLVVMGITVLGFQFTTTPSFGQEKKSTAKEGKKGADKSAPIDLLKDANPVHSDELDPALRLLTECRNQLPAE